MRESTDYDVAVIGGGLNGMTAALAVAACGFRVVVIEPRATTYPLPDAFDPRNYAITQASIQILKNLGVWTYVDEQRNADIERMEVWDANSRGRLEFSSGTILAPRFGVISEHANLGRALHQAIGGHAKVEFREAEVQDINLEPDARELVFDDASRLRATLVLCVDGAWSTNREKLGILSTPVAYQQNALVCNVRTGKPHSNVARQVFQHEGPLAFLPLADAHQSAIVWTNSVESAENLMALDAHEFARRLETAFGQTLGDIEVLSERFAFPLYKMHVSRYDAERAALVGDAAHVVHPLAGQGLNLGIMDAAVLAEVLAPLAERSKMPATNLRRALRRYSRWRAHDNALMLHATDKLNQLFAQHAKPLQLARGLGLNLTNKIPPLMRMFVQHAVGKAGELPALARADYR